MKLSTQVDNKLLLFFFGFTILAWVVPGAGFIIYPGLSIYALRGPKAAIQAFTILMMMNLGHPSIFPKTSAALRWLVLFAGLFGVLVNNYQMQRYRKITPPLFLLAAFFIVMLPASLTASFAPAISALKLLSFYAGAVTILLAYQKTRDISDYWVVWFNTYFIYIVLACVLLLPLGMGYERTTNGYQGIFGHPQVLGSFGAIAAAWCSGRYLFERDRGWPYLIITLLSWFVVYYSGSRTGLFSAIFGIFGAAAVYTILLRPIPQFKELFRIGLVAVLLAGAVFALAPDRIIGSAVNFFQKGAESSSLNEAFEDSRGFLIERSLQNFYDYPMLGIGLGIPSDYELAGSRNVTRLMGVPVSATVEKGFLPSAILEEMGLVGAFFSVLILMAFILPVAGYGSFNILWLLLTSFLINMGEAVLFSLGGKGLIVWLMFGLCYTLTQKKD